MPPKKSQETRLKILDAALDLFRERGFEEATMREVAARAGVATGLAYYYFRSKPDLVMAFYQRAMEEMAPLLEKAHQDHPKLEDRLRAIVQTKFDYFGPNRNFLGALMGQAADPASPLSPFGAETGRIREADFAHFDRALNETGTRVPKDLQPHMPKILWLYQMGQILFWIYDWSPGQKRAYTMLDKSLHIAVLLIKLSSLPLMRPARRMVVELIEIVES
jgi:AcrR family transcriptional regulator